MFLFYVLSLFKKGDTIQGGTLSKGGHYLRKYGTLAISFGYFRNGLKFEQKCKYLYSGGRLNFAQIYCCYGILIHVNSNSRERFMMATYNIVCDNQLCSLRTQLCNHNSYITEGVYLHIEHEICLYRTFFSLKVIRFTTLRT